MVTLANLLPDAQRILGSCESDYVLRRINDAIEILNNKGDFDSSLMVVDIAACNPCVVPMPPEVETVIAINALGQPTVGFDRMFSFHLDGPGDMARDTFLKFWWIDGADSCVFENPKPAGRLFATAANGADVGTILTVYGVDVNGDPLGTVQAGVFVPGFPVTVQASGIVPPTADPLVVRIDRVTKPDTTGRVMLFSRDPVNTANFQQLAIYRSNWKEPIFRLIRIGRPCPWVRVLFRKRNVPVSRPTDLIPLHSTAAVLAMLKALKAYDQDDLDRAQGFEATGMRWLEEENRTRRANLRMPPQIDVGSSLLPGFDQIT